MCFPAVYRAAFVSGNSLEGLELPLKNIQTFLSFAFCNESDEGSSHSSLIQIYSFHKLSVTVCKLIYTLFQLFNDLSCKMNGDVFTVKTLNQMCFSLEKGTVLNHFVLNSRGFPSRSLAKWNPFLFQRVYFFVYTIFLINIQKVSFFNIKTV